MIKKKTKVFNSILILPYFREALKSKKCASHKPTPEEDTGTHFPSVPILVMVGTVAFLILVMLFAVYLKRQGKCQNLRTYRITIPSMSIRVKKPHKHRHKKEQDGDPDSDNESTHIKPTESETRTKFPNQRPEKQN